MDVRWPGFGETATVDGHKLLYMGKDARCEHGVDFLLLKVVVKPLLAAHPYLAG